MTADTAFEERLTQGLRALAAEAEIPPTTYEELGFDPDRSEPLASTTDVSLDGSRDDRWHRSRRFRILAAAAAVAVVAGTIQGLSREPNAGQEVAADRVADTSSESSPPAAQVDGAGAERFVLEPVPDDFRVSALADTADLGEPDSTYAWHVYGHDGTDLPSVNAPRVTIFVVSGRLAPPLSGALIDLDGREAVVEEDGTVGFEVDDTVVRVRADSESDALELATALIVKPSGEVQPPVDGPGGSTHLGVLRHGLWEGTANAAPLAGHVADYRGDAGRWITISSEPTFANALGAIAWSSETAEMEEVGSRSVLFTKSGDARAASWIEGGSLVRVLAYRVTEAELRSAVATTRSVEEWPQADADIEPIEVAGPPGDTTQLDGSERAVTTNPPAGFELILSADNRALGEPFYSSQTYVWSPPTIEEAGSFDTSILMTVTEAVPAYPGETIDIAGTPGILIDQEASNTDSDLFVSHLGISATFSSRNTDLDDVIALATAWVESAATRPPVILANGYELELVASDAGWQGYGGPSGVTGTPNGSTAVYQDPDDRTRVLGVQSAPLEESGGVDYVRWTFPDRVRPVELGGLDVLLFEPVPGYSAVRFESSGRLITVWGEFLNQEELLAAAGALRAATEDEWGVGL